jgi:hypothetical protein
MARDGTVGQSDAIERSLPEYWLLKSAAHLLSVPIGRIFALAPLLNLLLIVLAVVLLDTLCDGKFVCQL